MDKQVAQYKLQRFAELGRLSASLLHELSNPLTAALLHLEMSHSKSPAIKKAKRDILLMRQYVEAARQQACYQSKPVIFKAKPQFEQLKRIVVPVAKQAGVQLEFSDLPPCQILGDPVKFQQIFVNLIVNAIEAYSEQEPVRHALLVNITFARSHRWLTVRVIDWGQGITPLELPRLFEPFYTSKENTSHGLGIGLAIVKQYAVVDFGGSIKVSSSRRRGTRFTIKLPLCEN